MNNIQNEKTYEDYIKKLQQNLHDKDYTGGGRLIVLIKNKDDQNLIKYAFYMKGNKIYLDCSAKRIWAKHTIGIFYAPMHMVFSSLFITAKIIVNIVLKKDKEMIIPLLLCLLLKPCFFILIETMHTLIAILSPMIAIISKKASTSLIMWSREKSSILMKKTHQNNDEIGDCFFIGNYMSCFHHSIDTNDYGSKIAFEKHVISITTRNCNNRQQHPYSNGLFDLLSCTKVNPNNYTSPAIRNQNTEFHIIFDE
jgi:hypothetical protein